MIKIVDEECLKYCKTIINILIIVKKDEHIAHPFIFE